MRARTKNVRAREMPLPNYLITLIRTVAQEATVVLSAPTQQEAEDLAIELKGDQDWATYAEIEDATVHTATQVDE